MAYNLTVFLPQDPDHEIALYPFSHHLHTGSSWQYSTKMLSLSAFSSWAENSDNSPLSFYLVLGVQSPIPATPPSVICVLIIQNCIPGVNLYSIATLFIYLFLAVLGLRFVRGLSLVTASGGHSSSRCAGLSLSRPLPLRGTGSRRAGSVAVAHGPSCSVACGIFPDQGSNPCPLH